MTHEAIILAGGLGSRFGARTKVMPKGFITLDEAGEAIVKKSVDKLIAIGVDHIIIGTGHCANFYDELAYSYNGLVETVCNEDYAKTSSMGTLERCIPKVLSDSVFLLESDLIYDSIGLWVLQQDKDVNVILTSGKTGSGDEVYVKAIGEAKEGAPLPLLDSLGKDLTKDATLSELTGISKVSKTLLDAMSEYYRQKRADKEEDKIDYESVFGFLVSKEKIFVHKIEYYNWAEVDNEDMLTRAKDLVYPKIKEAESLRRTRREVLLNPGPSTTTESVKFSQVVPDICPREAEFGDLMSDIARDLTRFVADDGEFNTIFFGGSGTAADEAMVSSCVPPGGRLLVIDNGSYGARLATIARVYKIDMDVFKSSPYEALDLKKLESAISNGGYSALAAVYHETTTGLLNPIGEICALAKAHGLITIVDAVSAYGGIPMDLKKLGIDFAAATSNKHIGGMAGLGFVVARIEELEKQRDWPMRAYYLNLYDQWKNFLETKQTRFTPPVQTIYALRQAILETKCETIEGRYKRFTDCWKILVSALDDLGLEMLVDRTLQSHFITAVKNPKNLPRYSFDEFHDMAKTLGFTIYPGKLGNIGTFRIANMGDITTAEMVRFCSVMKGYFRSL